MPNSNRADDPHLHMSRVPPALQAGRVRHAEHQSFHVGGSEVSNNVLSGGTSQRSVEHSYEAGELAPSQVS